MQIQEVITRQAKQWIYSTMVTVVRRLNAHSLNPLMNVR